MLTLVNKHLGDSPNLWKEGMDSSKDSKDFCRDSRKLSDSNWNLMDFLEAYVDSR